jgi:hypothetical protein
MWLHRVPRVCFAIYDLGAGGRHNESAAPGVTVVIYDHGVGRGHDESAVSAETFAVVAQWLRCW